MIILPFANPVGWLKTQRVFTTLEKIGLRQTHGIDGTEQKTKLCQQNAQFLRHKHRILNVEREDNKQKIYADDAQVNKL